MGQSVSYLNHASNVTFFDVSGFDEYEWDDLVENLQYELSAKFPSLNSEDYWDDRIFMANAFCEIAISEYSGLASISIRAKEEDNDYRYIMGLSKHWIKKTWLKIEQIIAGLAGTLLVKQATFSNGEAYYVACNLSRRFCHNQFGITYEF